MVYLNKTKCYTYTQLVNTYQWLYTIASHPGTYAHSYIVCMHAG